MNQDLNTPPQTPRRPTTYTANQRERYAAIVVREGNDDDDDVFGSLRSTSRSETPNGKAGFPPTQTLPSIFNTPPSPQRRKFSAYVIYSGKKIGVFTTWDKAQTYLNGVPYARWKGFSTLAEACTDFKNAYDKGRVGRAGEALPHLVWPEGIAFEGFHDENGIGNSQTTELHRASETVSEASAQGKTPEPNKAEYFVVLRGKYPGVFRHQSSVDTAIGESGNDSVVTLGTEAEANAQFVKAFMSSEIIAYNDDGSIRRIFGPYL